MKTTVHHLNPSVSSNVAAYTYDHATGAMDVTFRSGGTYRYAGISPSTFSAFEAAKSKGGFVAERLRGKHPTKKLT